MNEPTPRAWTFSALELTVLWHAIGRDVLPYPMRYRSAEDTADAYHSAYRAAAARLRTVFDEDLYGPLRVLVEPEARIEVAGFAEATPPVPPRADPVPGSRVRIHAAVAGQNAVLLTQQPTADAERGGDVRLMFTAARTLVPRILTALPGTPRGRGPEIRVDRNTVEDAEAGAGPFTGFFDDTPKPGRDEAQRFFERPRSAVVHIAVYAGGAYDHRPAPARDFHIMDYPDGRYRVRATGAIHATPAGTADLSSHLHNLLDRTLREHREDHDIEPPRR